MYKITKSKGFQICYVMYFSPMTLLFLYLAYEFFLLWNYIAESNMHVCHSAFKCFLGIILIDMTRCRQWRSQPKNMGGAKKFWGG